MREKIQKSNLVGLYPYRSHFLQLEENNLHYLDEGEGQPVLMLHGNPTWSFFYRHLVEALRSSYRTIVPDHMGMGLSDRPQGYSYHLETHIQNTIKLIRFLDLKKIILVVHDWGGAIGMGVVSRYPELFDKLVIMNTAAFPSPHIPKRINFLRSKSFGEYLIRKWNLFVWPATFMAPRKKLSSKVKEGFLLPYDSFENRIAIARFVQDIPMEKSHPSYETLLEIEKKLPSLTHPKLILWGGQDFCFNEHFFYHWKKLYPEALSFWLPQAGHYLLEDAPLEVTERIKNFIN